MQSAPGDRSKHSSEFALPLVVAVTGHRNLKQSEIPRIEKRVAGLFQELIDTYPERKLVVMSSLAPGADQLVAEQAIRMDLGLIAALPMPRSVYVDDFQSTETRGRFDALLSEADDVIELPIANGSSEAQLRDDSAARNHQYAQSGVFVSAHCHILLALWDGNETDDVGGTGQVVKFHHDDVMPGFSPKTVATQQMLVDDESDLVFHIVCSRQNSESAVNPELEPLDWFWFTKDPNEPRAKQMPEQHRLVFRRSAEFSRDAQANAAAIEKESESLLEDAQNTTLPDGIESVDRLFRVADWLAIHYGGRTTQTLRVLHILAFVMGLSFILYSDARAWQSLLYAFLVFFVAASVVQYVFKRGAWRRKYLDYRTLAEGLRVQYYWAVAGARNEVVSKFAHDSFLQTQDPELGWIRNVMRVAGIRCDAFHKEDASGLKYVLDSWIGDSNTGQLGFYRQRSSARVRRKRITDAIGTASLLTSVVVVAVFVVFGNSVPTQYQDPMTVAMGTMLLLFAIRHGYAHNTAENELIRQYDFMLRIFENADRRLKRATDAVEKRQVLLALGGSALDEHAEWILMHRERTLDQGDVWRIGSGS